jgi:hypothetical protein
LSSGRRRKKLGGAKLLREGGAGHAQRTESKPTAISNERPNAHNGIIEPRKTEDDRVEQHALPVGVSASA